MGSVPHTDPSVAWDLMLQHFRHLPCWPQLPRRTYQENMYVQFSERFPGLTVERERIYVDRRKDLDPALEELYLAYLEGNLQYGALSAEHAAGLAMLRRGEIALPYTPLALKGQVTGPISWGLMVVDQNQRPILYDKVLADAVAKHLRLKAAWQERELRKLAPQTVMFVDEPYMASFGSAFVSLRREQVLMLLGEVFAGLQGLKGIHCCGNTDWSILLNTAVDILSLDAYDYAETLSFYPEDVTRFLQRGGIIAWGIVPAGTAAESETVESLVARLEENIAQLVQRGVPRAAIARASMVTPSCGLGTQPPQLAERILDLTVGVAEAMQRLNPA
jgi:hypothetical protein